MPIKRVKKPHPHDVKEIRLPLEEELYVTVRRTNHRLGATNQHTDQMAEISRSLSLAANQSVKRLEEQGFDGAAEMEFGELAAKDGDFAKALRELTLREDRITKNEQATLELAASLVATWRGDFGTLPKDIDNGNFNADHVMAEFFGDESLSETVPQFSSVDPAGNIKQFLDAVETPKPFEKACGVVRSAEEVFKAETKAAEDACSQVKSKAQDRVITSKLEKVKGTDDIGAMMATAVLEVSQLKEVKDAEEIKVKELDAAQIKRDDAVKAGLDKLKVIEHPYKGLTLRQCIAKAIVDAAAEQEKLYRQSMAFFV